MQIQEQYEFLFLERLSVYLANLQVASKPYQLHVLLHWKTQHLLELLLHHLPLLQMWRPKMSVYRRLKHPLVVHLIVQKTLRCLIQRDMSGYQPMWHSLHRYQM